MRFSSDLGPNDSEESQPTIGIIGMGAMGRIIHVCDLPQKFEQLQKDYTDVAAVKVFKDGHGVSRSSDFIMYAVEAEFIKRVVAEYGPSTKVDAVVAGQTSVKAPERDAFEKYLPEDTHIVSCHSLHGPTVSPIGQPLIIIRHRATDAAVALVHNILRCFGSRFVHLSYDEHDLVTANTQAVTHAAFLSMGTAWACSQDYPWEHGLYVKGIETVKVNLAIRIYSNAWHVYAGLAILNPKAREQIDQYAKSATELFKLMLLATSNSSGKVAQSLEEGEKKLRERVEWAKGIVFGDKSGHVKRRPILLSADILDQFGMGKKNAADGRTTPVAQNNSHLSLLAMVDCWAHLNINPFHHLALAATPLFRLFLGVSEYLFLDERILATAVHSAIYDTWHRADDLEFVTAARGWSQCVRFGSFEVYRKRFDHTRTFFESRFEESSVLGSQMIKKVMESEMERELEQSGES